MRPYTPDTNKGRTVARDDIHHETADGGFSHRIARAKTARKAARRDGRQEATEAANEPSV